MENKTIASFFLLLAFASQALFGQSNQFYFASQPTLSPDASKIVFSYAGDLWMVRSEGGEAMRLTAMEGEEYRPNISPDGKWLAFTATQYGNPDVYIMPLEGGEIKQLTFHQAADDVESWAWDSQTIYFTSSRVNNFTTYTVGIDGKTPKRLFDHYFNTVHNAVEHPTSGEIYFNETWESNRFVNRKKYKGAYNPDIKSYNPETGEYKEYTDYIGKDMWAMIDQKGTVYFVSTEANEQYNLYTFKDGQKTQLTSFESSVYYPKISADGSKIVFEKDYQLHVYDVASGETTKVPIKIFTNNTLAKAQDFKVSGNISGFDVSPDNKKLAFISRGELFVSDVEGKFIKQLETSAEGRVMEVKWLSDNKTLVFNQTVGGYLNYFSIAADGKGAEKQLTSDEHNNRNLTFDAEKKKGVYLGGRDEIRMMDLETMASETLLKEEMWDMYAPMPYLSPDGKYVLFSPIRNFEREIFVYHIPTKTKTNLTKTGVAESDPFWGPEGKYIYYVSNRTQPSYPFGMQDARVYRMALTELENPYRSDKFEELFEEKEEKGDDEDADDKKKKGKKDKDAKEEKEEKKPELVIKISEEGIMERVQRVSPNFGSQGAPYVIKKDDKIHVLYGSNHDERKYAIWNTTYEEFEKTKTKKIEGLESGGFEIAFNDKQYYLLGRGNIHKLNLGGNKVEKIDISYTFRKNLSSEFNQMFYETWANLEQNFYNETFHGTDWAKMRDDFVKFLPYVTSRAELRRIINDMLGELNSSHLGFYSFGKEENGFYRTASASAGIVFENEQPYVVKTVVSKTPAALPQKDIEPGDKLVAVNGVAVVETTNRETYFNTPSLDEEMLLTFERAGVKKEVKLHPEPYYSTRFKMYNEWTDANQKYVDEKSENRIAYVHMKNMGGGELDNFMREMVSEAYKKDALILDLRYNTGGNVHDKVLQFLSHKPYLNWKYREGQLTQQSNFGPAAKPIVLLINEQSLSDAEMTAGGFKELGLGKIIGTETYRWIIFTSGKGLVDGSFYRLPSWGCYTLDGKNLEAEGVKPDIFVPKNFKDRLDGNHPQLDKAIEEILKELE
ncbi:S41 family peptidase [Flammeovirgaceae bacterium SG7u.111]|nr:S41 family peptidase [Flammeovirgaceae bacterium SG7u.132]WPO38729.1 S41 family peptidase [Flammeovirgaceae bacterium SG7u.111]